MTIDGGEKPSVKMPLARWSNNSPWVYWVVVPQWLTPWLPPWLRPREFGPPNPWPWPKALPRWALQVTATGLCLGSAQGDAP